MAPHVVNFLLGSFGIVAAILLIGGSVFLRAQKNRQRYELMRRAIDTNTPLPKGPPLWLAAQRQAVSTLTLGVGLLIVGVIAWGLGSGTSMPADAGVPATQPVVMRSDLLGPPLPPPPPSPAVEAWHSAQQRVAVGQTASACGVILALLGVVRLGYTKVERRVEENGETAFTSTEPKPAD